jgi:hypothetical protein
VSGSCDVVEFLRDENGAELAGREGRWRPYPVEYKRGVPKETDADRLQLCCQALCLEEMLCCEIPEGALFYGETRRRERVELTDELRARCAPCCCGDARVPKARLYAEGQAWPALPRLFAERAVPAEALQKPVGEGIYLQAALETETK